MKLTESIIDQLIAEQIEKLDERFPVDMKRDPVDRERTRKLKSQADINKELGLGPTDLNRGTQNKIAKQDGKEDEIGPIDFNKAVKDAKSSPKGVAQQAVVKIKNKSTDSAVKKAANDAWDNRDFAKLPSRAQAAATD